LPPGIRRAGRGRPQLKENDMLETKERTRVVAWSDPRAISDAGRGLAGIEFLRRIRSGDIAPPPVAVLLGMALTEVNVGHAVMTSTAGEHLYNPIGTVHGGILATLLDSAMGCAVHSTLPPGRGYTTLEIKVNYVRAVTEAAGEVTAEAHVVHAGGRTAVAEARLTDDSGRLYATASTTCLLFDLPAATLSRR
jgi:uncharacterized protein (TIGR00369 family)